MSRWNIVGPWEISQTNRFRVVVDVPSVGQEGNFLVQAQVEGGPHGQGGGMLHADDVHFTINWDNGPVGAYNGAFDERGVIHGATFDINHPESFAGWTSSRVFRKE
jgi:hypothetical protein